MRSAPAHHTAPTAGATRPSPAVRVASILALALVGALVLASCARPQPAGDGGSSTIVGTDQPAQSVAGQLLGRTFLSTEVSGRDLVPGSQISLTFREDGSIGAAPGCNAMGGALRWAGEHFSASDVAQTEMACDQPLMDQDEWVAAFLAGPVAASVDGSHLRLRNGGITIDLLDRKVANPDRPLAGTEWQVDGVMSGVGDAASISSVPVGITATMRIDNGHINAFDGLHTIGIPSDPAVTVAIEGDIVRVPEPGAMTQIGCATEDGTTGAATVPTDCFVDMSVLSSDFRYEIDADRLTVTGIGPTEASGLTFRAAPAP